MVVREVDKSVPVCVCMYEQYSCGVLLSPAVTLIWVLGCGPGCRRMQRTCKHAITWFGTVDSVLFLGCATNQVPCTRPFVFDARVQGYLAHKTSGF